MQSPLILSGIAWRTEPIRSVRHKFLLNGTSSSPTDFRIQYSLPIVAPPGRSGLDPNLELLYYSSFIKSEYLGLGWTTNIPYIECINRTGAANLYTENYFLSSFDGELLAITVFLPPCLAGDWLTNSSTVSHGRRPWLR